MLNLPSKAWLGIAGTLIIGLSFAVMKYKLNKARLALATCQTEQGRLQEQRDQLEAGIKNQNAGIDLAKAQAARRAAEARDRARAVEAGPKGDASVSIDALNQAAKEATDVGP